MCVWWCCDVGFVTCGPSEAMLVTGICYGSKPHVVPGGVALVFPGIHRVIRIPLQLMTEIVRSPHVFTKHGVMVHVTGVAQVSHLNRYHPKELHRIVD